jgi:uncharacterized protein YjbI with pentapeptide repeats
MAQYGEVRVDFITYTSGVSDNVTVTVSSLVDKNTVSGNLTVSGEASIQGGLFALSGITTTTGTFASGTVANPSITFTGDLDTGLYEPLTDELGIAVGGLARAVVSTTGVAFGGAGAITTPVGTSGQRPTAVEGMIRLNSEAGSFEGYRNGSWQQLTDTPGADLNPTFETVTVQSGLTVSGDALFSSGITVSGTISGLTITGESVNTTALTATVVTGTTITGDSVNTTALTSTVITGVTITGTTVNVGDFTSQTISGVSVNATTITGQTISGVGFAATSITGTTITGTSINAVTITGQTITGTTVNATAITGQSISGLTVNATTANATTANIVSGIFASGTAAAPSITFSGDKDTGIYTAEAGNINFTTQGVERVSISESGVITAKNGAVAEIANLAWSATPTPDFASSCNFNLVLSGGTTLGNPTNATPGQVGSIFVIQDGVGSHSFAYDTNWDFIDGSGFAVSGTANSVSRLDYIVRTATSIHCVGTGPYS